MPGWVPPVLSAMAAEDGEVLRAIQFNDAFRPQDGVVYTHVLTHLKAQYTAANDAFKSVDDKALAIVNYLGGSTGLLALASAAAVNADKIDPGVAVFSVPAFVAAALSVAFAALARRPMLLCAPPSGAAAVRQADYYKDADKSEAALIGQWNLSTIVLLHATDRKSQWLIRATWCFVTSLALLILPLGKSAFGKAAHTPPTSADAGERVKADGHKGTGK
ncbi:hypothetical protein [Fimbriiglobus ruber]|uniref:Pycsar effector protein domain-containing protein n=1 Tax=Fimbriiglobus ruber TaxID=1908690 RepID=A0A225DFX2_9BACT|nr:hypothetical protein [Fimbriiglobus ruber]OWK34987.1 hypothetical protein FRUB_09829 [Fimbriiglobus ruber]